jgi:hypothetical protein
LFDTFQMALDEMGHLRARTDNAHVPPQHIEELGEFVEVELAQDRSNVGAARIVGSGPSPFRLAWPKSLHRSEFEHSENTSVETDAILPEQDGAWTFQLNGDRNCQHKRPKRAAILALTFVIGLLTDCCTR